MGSTAFQKQTLNGNYNKREMLEDHWNITWSNEILMTTEQGAYVYLLVVVVVGVVK
jgi:hypothetical protein